MSLLRKQIHYTGEPDIQHQDDEVASSTQYTGHLDVCFYVNNNLKSSSMIPIWIFHRLYIPLLGP